jgi:hypothetical protein
MSRGSDFNKPGLKFRKSILILIRILGSLNLAAWHVLWMKFLQVLLFPFDLFLAALEKFNKVSGEQEVPVIFVVGIQRTGSTLISQFIENTFPFFPLGNSHAVFRQSDYYIHRCLAKQYHPSRNSYQNYYGIARGFFSVGDCYEVWDRWFGKNHYIIPDDIPENKLISMKACFSGLYGAAHRPILTKNNRNSLMISLFNKVFPRSFFVIVRRDPIPVIRSTLKASIDFFGHHDLLWGLYPDREFDTGNYENIVEAATVQYLRLDKLMAEQIGQLDESDYIEIDYDDFCAEPQRFQIRLAEKINRKIPFITARIRENQKEFSPSTRLGEEHLDSEIRRYYKKWVGEI